MYLSKLKKGICIIGGLLLLVSCSKYQQLLRKGELSEKYKAAETFYKGGDYKRALRLFEQIVPAYRGKPQGERISFYEADTYYKLEDHYIAKYKFERFAKSHPKSDKLEEALYKEAKSAYELSSSFSLDQKETLVALEKFQTFINEYPESEFLENSNTYTAALRFKLEKKYYKIAKQFHHRELYKPAIKAFSNYLVDYPGSKYTEKVLFYRLESAYELAINSFDKLVPERLHRAQEFYEAYSDRSKNEELKKKAEDIATDIKNRQQAFNI